jgi:hypothetical protein
MKWNFLGQKRHLQTKYQGESFEFGTKKLLAQTYTKSE